MRNCCTSMQVEQANIYLKSLLTNCFHPDAACDCLHPSHRRRSLLSFLGRHLLNPIYAEANKFVGPDTPSFRYKTNPSPARYNTDLKVRSEHPWADVYHKEKDWVNAKAATKVDTWEGAKFAYKAGKGASEYKFNSGKRAFEVKNKEEYKVNFPETDIKIAGGQPILVDQKAEVYGATANETINFATGDGPKFDNKWEVNVGSTQFGSGRWVLLE